MKWFPVTEFNRIGPQGHFGLTLTSKNSYLSNAVLRAIKANGPFVLGYDPERRQVGFRHDKVNGYVSSQGARAVMRMLETLKVPPGKYRLIPGFNGTDYLLNLPSRGKATIISSTPGTEEDEE